MNNQEGNYDSLLESVEVVVGRDLQERQKAAIAKVLSRVSWKWAVSIVREFSRLQNPPRNVYGWMCDKVDEIKDEERKRIEGQTQWEADKDCLNGKEMEVLFGILDEIMTWHELDLVSKTPGGCTDPMDVEGWIKAGRPKTWSQIVDHFLAGSEPAYKQDKQMPGTLYAFWVAYLKSLRDERTRRSQQVVEARRKAALEELAKRREQANKAIAAPVVPVQPIEEVEEEYETVPPPGDEDIIY